MLTIKKLVLFILYLFLVNNAFADQFFDQKRIEQTLVQKSEQVQQYDMLLLKKGTDQSKLIEYREALQTDVKQLQSLITELTPVLANIKSDIADLGPAPVVEEGEKTQTLEKEPENIKSQREELTEKQLKIEGLLIEAEALISKSGRLLTKIAAQLLNNFIGQLFETQYSLFNSGLWDDSIVEYKDHLTTLPVYLNYQILTNTGVIISTLLLFILLIVSRGISDKHFKVELAQGSDLPLLSTVAISLWPPLLALLVGLAILYQALITQNLITEDNESFIHTLFWTFTFTIGIFFITKKLKLASVIRNTSRWMINFSALLFVFDALILAISPLANAPVIFAVTQSYVVTTAFALILIGLAYATLVKNKTKPTYLLPVKFFWGLLAIGLIILAANIFGYAALSRFIFERIILLTSLLLVFLLIRAFALPLFIKLDHAFQGDSADKAIKQSQKQENLMVFWLKLALDILLVLVSIPILAAFAGTEWIIIKDWILRAFFGFEIGSVNITISTIAIGFGFFFALLFLTRLIQKLLSEKVLPKTRIEDSLQQSIIQVAGYIGLIVALLVGISSLGFDLTSLALIAGALSVGIGFGLQSIVSNFVSGLILLFERPIKIGDWIITNSGEGIVKKINVRATEVETFDRTSIIIPNSELISASVKNWTHKDKIGRIIIKVGVSYDSDPHQVLELLKEYVTDNDLLLQWPKPKIVFMDFADSALIFDLRFFIHDIQEVNEIQTQVRLDIWDLFKAHDIEISYPQRDIHIRSAAGLKELAHDQ